MANITLKDGAVREVAEGTTVLDFVKSFSNSLAKKALACKIDGETKDLMWGLISGEEVETEVWKKSKRIFIGTNAYEKFMRELERVD